MRIESISIVRPDCRKSGALHLDQGSFYCKTSRILKDGVQNFQIDFKFDYRLHNGVQMPAMHINAIQKFRQTFSQIRDFSRSFRRGPIAAFCNGTMMTSSNGNIFRVTGPLCGEFTGPGEFPTQRLVTWSFHVSLICVWINGWVNNRDAGDLRRYRGHYDVNVMTTPNL